MIGKEPVISYSVITNPGDELLREAARLHVEQLSYRSFITFFGNKFILELYKDLLKAELGFLVFALADKTVAGFVLGCTDSKKLFTIITKKFIKYSFLILPQIIKKPGLVARVFETLFYVKKENTEVASELVVIVTDPAYRSTGIGSRLLEILDQEFIKRSIREYKVTVHDEMERSNNFYNKNGFLPSSSFMMYKVKWNLYIKHLNAK